MKTGSAPTPGTMDVPMYMLLDLAVGGVGSWPGAPNATTTFPASYQVDYVRAYTTANTSFVGGSAAACYAEGTRLLTDAGEVAIERLTVGNRLVAARDGVARPIV